MMLERIARRVRTGRVLCEDFAAYLGLEAARCLGGRRPHAVRLRHKPGRKTWFRNATTDYATLVSCFAHGYHRPVHALPPRPTILDLGANVGYTMIDFKYHHPHARVIGVEMDETNAALCRRNIEGLVDCEVVHAAVWIEDGEVAYEPHLDADAFQVCSDPSAVLAPGARRIRAARIHTIFEQCKVRRAHYVKLDIEGAEKDLFECGDTAWLDRVDQIGIELHDTIDAKAVMDRLHEHGMQASVSDRHWNSVVGWRA